MSRFRDAPIRRKISVAILATTLASVGLMAMAFSVHDYLGLRRATLREVATLGHVVAANTTDALAFGSSDDALEVLRELAGDRRVLGAGLYDARGALFARYPNTAAGAAALPAGPGGDGFDFEPTAISGFEPVVQKGRRLGTLFLKYDTGSIFWEWVKSSAGTAAGVLIGILGFAFLLSRALERRISGPILALSEAAKAVAERKDYAVRAVKAGDDELGLLTDAFNHMLDQIITLNRDLEKRVEQRTAQLEAANRELEAFSYSVSHDLRAPLRHVDGFAAMLRKHIHASLDDKGRRYLNTISDSAKKMGQLIDDLLAFSRIGRAQLARVQVDHDLLVAGVIRDGRYEDGLPRIEWIVAKLPPVHADPALLRQVWSNLIGNAVKYSGKAAQPRVTITGVRTPEECIFSVADNGVGFDMAYAHKLFGVFQRLHGPAEFEGTGIGLANVRRIVMRHGGRTWAEGKVGGGATFHFSLPHGAAEPASST